MFHELLSLLNDKLVRKMKLNEITSYLLILFFVYWYIRIYFRFGKIAEMPKTGVITIYRRLAKSFCIKKGTKIINKQWMPLSGWLSSLSYWLDAASPTPSPGVAAATYLTPRSGAWITRITTIRSVWTPSRSVPGPPSW